MKTYVNELRFHSNYGDELRVKTEDDDVIFDIKCETFRVEVQYVEPLIEKIRQMVGTH